MSEHNANAREADNAAVLTLLSAFEQAKRGVEVCSQEFERAVERLSQAQERVAQFEQLFEQLRFAAKLRQARSKEEVIALLPPVW